MATTIDVVVTGASGFVGGHIAADLGRRGYAVLAVGGTRPIAEQASRAGALEIRGDLADRSFAKESVGGRPAKLVVHAAALADAARCEREPERAERLNVDATRNVVEAAADAALRFVHISTDLVFDGAPPAPEGGISEEAPPEPRSVYARTKRRSEEVALEGHPRPTVLRIALVYGPPLGMAGEGFLGWMVQSLRDGRDLTLFTDELRTPVYAPDIGALIASMLEREDASRQAPRLLHLGGPERCSRHELGLRVAHALGAPPDHIRAGLRADAALVPARPRDVSLCSDLAVARYDLRRTTIDEGLQRSLGCATRDAPLCT